jgi:diguanylate cyclase (GGDEF)-like protein
LRKYLLGGLVAVVVQELLPVSVARDVLYSVIGLGTVAAIVVGIRRNRPSNVVPWVLLAVGVLSWTLGDTIWAGLVATGREPFPSVADVLYLVGYPLFAGCLFQMTRSRNPAGDRTGALDAAIVGVVALFVLGVALIEPSIQAADGAVAEALVAAAYPVGDLLLLIQLVHLRSAGLHRHASMRLLVGAMGITLLADLLYQMALYDAWLAANVHLLDILWMVAYLLFGAAAMHPSMIATTARQPRLSVVGSLTTGQLGVIALAAATIPLTVFVEVVAGRPPHLAAAALTTVAAIALTYVRMTALTRAVRGQAERLARLAETDVLTGVANKQRFIDEVADRLADPAVAEVPVLFVVLDRFAEINDTLGHRVGDELLCAAAERMGAAVGDHGLVGRVRGDSFAVMVRTGGQCTGDVTACAAELRQELLQPFALSDVTVSVDALVGVAVGPVDGDDGEELLQRADVALSVARDRADGIARYTGGTRVDGVPTAHLVGELSAALLAGDIVVHYQPQVLLETGKVVGVEALVRWQHPVHGLLPPVAFIPAAERTGLIRPLTLYVLNSALEQVARWRVDGMGLSVAVNLSVRDLLDPQFVEDVRQAIARYGVPAHALELEITETMAMVDPKRSVLALEALREMGVTLSLDDYGTGYSSLVYLQRLPVQRLKIDRSFVAHLLDDSASAAIVASTIDLAGHLGMTVVAEGVEDDATLLALRELSCDAAQGFGLGRPVSPEAIPDLVRLIEKHVPLALSQKVPVGRRIV